MAKKRKSKKIKVIFLEDYEKYKKGDIGEISRSLFFNVLKRNNTAREPTKKDEINYQEKIKRQEKEKKQRELERIKFEEERKRQEKILKENKKKEFDELKNKTIEEIYKDFDTIYKKLGAKDSENFDNLSRKISLKIKINEKEGKNEDLSNSKIREYYEKIIELLQKESFKELDLEIILAKAKYDLGRVKTINNSFIDFLEYNIERIGDKKEYLFIFKKHFESILAYTK